MTTSTEEWLSHLHRLIDRDNYIYADDLRNWGFTIYRTCYTPSSDEKWPQLLETIQTCAHNDVLSQTQSKEDDAQFKKVMSLFRLDARSEPSLSALTIPQLRELYNTTSTDPPLNSDFPLRRVFLVASAETFWADEPDTVITCVDADYRTENYVSRGRYTQQYFGWMPMRARCVAEFWEELQWREMDRIAPQTIGGRHLVVWGGGQPRFWVDGEEG
ncbi:hypothetical protein HBH56_198930 [Parastagonospora nodorum]|uniref:Uncharacterized protein n=1 Tax=Phaeosphaeria nodorum (strain SN15 / ATCC MYA-4574 / FGSC 10173) TaxID=321614 RepID=A0A7U2F511_PHANO|nr:hypothetical protein HBH56_198930 [Parastagonospora nodorum]QRC97728.1 hypothetical protein JI435_085050 [Parastagonospora nodorum SN15]KAH3924722.1 hypothetical protein HBH54_191890 [Parastagonospora nodorum]KAH4130771.1 hypothetical protein HBH45_194310 [Parastagonospora nodorum]KAH4150449.1 hypothetical protein HBH44_182360 [Parastagonospora nodorum]